MVALVPEGLPATMSVSLAIAVRRMARRQALIKRLTAVEGLGSTTVICTDKTGTLTKAEMTVQVVWESGRQHADLRHRLRPRRRDQPTSGPRARCYEWAHSAATRGCLPRILLAPSAGGSSGTPPRVRSSSLPRRPGLTSPPTQDLAPRVATFPFDADRKLMTTVHRIGPDRYEAYVKGSPQAVLERTAAVRWDGEDESRRPRRCCARVIAANDAMAAEGLRVLAVARKSVTGRPVPARTRPSPASRCSALSPCPILREPRSWTRWPPAGSAGIRIFMVTGDYGLTAEAIARRVGIVVPVRSGSCRPRIWTR